jgi:hypothetical protein
MIVGPVAWIEGKGKEAKVRPTRKTLAFLFLVGFLPLLASCAAGQNVARGVPDPGFHVAGFWLGLWQGVIAPITFVISLFNHNVNIYEIHNNGGWYNFGFVLGAGVLLGGGGTAGSRRR